MQMTDSQYLRIERLAGGYSCSNRAFIKAASKRLSEVGRTRAYRAERHEWLRDGIVKLKSTRRAVY